MTDGRLKYRPNCRMDQLHEERSNLRHKKCENKWLRILVHVEGESTPHLVLKVKKRKYTLKDVRRLLDDII